MNLHCLKITLQLFDHLSPFDVNLSIEISTVKCRIYLFKTIFESSKMQQAIKAGSVSPSTGNGAPILQLHFTFFPTKLMAKLNSVYLGWS